MNGHAIGLENRNPFNYPVDDCITLDSRLRGNDTGKMFVTGSYCL